MIIRKISLGISIMMFFYIIYSWCDSRPIMHGPGILVPNPPLQTQLNDVKPFTYKDYKIIPLARFEIEARVLSRHRYYFGRAASLVPVDLALGWGPMSDEGILKSIDISQSNRFYYWFVKQFPIPKKDIITHSANMHLIPGNSMIRGEIKKVRKGAIVKFRGFLVRVEAQDGWRWSSSLSRTDSGNGACELVWVEDFETLN